MSDHYQERRKLEEFNEKLRNELQKWKRKARYDNLTGLLSRETFNEFSEKLLKKSDKTNSPLSFIRVDIDKFKYINDTYGHDIGDKVLKEVSKLIAETVRETDVFSRNMVGRYGGEEIDVILPNTDKSGAMIAGNRIRKAIEDRFKGKDVKVTVSAGVSSYTPRSQIKEHYTKEIETLSKKADENLYKAKETGRNKVVY